MVRQNSTGAASQRERQRRYRERLAAAREPETDDVQRAIYQALIGSIAEARQGRIPGDGGPRAVSVMSAFIKGLVTDALRRLDEAGYDPGRSRRRMRMALLPTQAPPSITG
ncbi:hypothetical protein ACFOYU_06110 [Microvirga sp. GCM10011540]|uniref:hypothetical protein n=1 Tax=Microvirga sp. GCM10011540 TaxID=3317338 RepID=UPI003622CFEC